MSDAMVQVQRRDAMTALTQQMGMDDPNEVFDILKNTVMPKASNEEVFAFALVCSKYGLNPLLKEVHAFSTKAGGIMPMVGIDGWLKIAHSHPNYAGMDWKEGGEGDGAWCECTVYLKDTPDHPVTIREYLTECRMPQSPVWQQRPRRMLRHRATIQAIRYALGISGIADPDDWQEAPAEGSMQARVVKPKMSFLQPQQPQEQGENPRVMRLAQQPAATDFEPAPQPVAAPEPVPAPKRRKEPVQVVEAVEVQAEAAELFPAEAVESEAPQFGTPYGD